MQFSENRWSQYLKLPVAVAWIVVTSIVIAVAAAILTRSFWLTTAVVGIWLIVTQMLYVAVILYLVSAEKRRQRRLLLRSDGEPLAIFAVESRMINLVGFDEGSATLVIEFHNGEIKFFHPVTEAMYLDLKTAPSPGAYYKQHLRHLHRR
jgi:hypothetical protein